MRWWYLCPREDDLIEVWLCRPAIAGPQAGFSRTAQTLGQKPLCRNPAFYPAISG
jgi:hypothetical protein